MILLIIAVGYIATKKGLFSTKARADMTNVVIYIILPCNIFDSFDKSITPETLWQFGVVLLISFGIQIMYQVLNKLLYIRIRPERQVVMKYATMTNNAAFMGLPIVDTILGRTGMIYGSVYLIPLRIFMWTAALSLYTRTDKKDMIKNLATHPCIWAVILGLAYALSPIMLPEFLASAISAIGRCTTALTMFIVGSILSGVELKSIVDKDCFYYSFLRLLAIPAVVFGVLTLIGVDPLVKGMAVLLSAMPASTVSASLAEKYGKDAVFASKMLFISTVLSIITLPVIAAVLMRSM